MRGASSFIGSFVSFDSSIQIQPFCMNVITKIGSLSHPNLVLGSFCRAKIRKVSDILISSPVASLLTFI